MAELWALHIQGPDELYGMPSKAKAEEVAERMNRVWNAMPIGMGEGQRPPGFVMNARAVLWPYSPSAHAKDLRENGIAELSTQQGAKA